MRFKSAVVFVFSFLFLVGSASASTWYVATGGNDSNPGTQSSPFRTITQAARIVQPGDVVNIRGGVYYEVVNLMKGGTSAARVTFQSYPGETAVVDGTGTALNTNLFTILADYIDVKGLEVRNSTRHGINGYDANHIRVLNNVTHDNSRSGIYFTHSSGGVATDLTITGNTVYRNVLENDYHNIASGWGQAVGLYRTDQSVISNNKVYKNQGEGIDFIVSSHGVAEHNDAYDNFGTNMYFDNARYMKANANFLHTTNDTRYYRNNYPANGITIANENYSTLNIGSDITITNNVITGGLCGIEHRNSDTNTGMKNVTVANNTFRTAIWAMVVIGNAPHSNVLFENNIFYQTGGGTMVESVQPNITFRNNNWYGATAGAAAGSGDIIGDPKLVNASGTTAADYKLTTYSPSIDKGISLATITSDYFGDTRSGAYDIGADEASAGGSLTDTIAPGAPTNLHVSGTTPTSVTIAWSASVDNVGIQYYKIYKNGYLVRNVTGTSTSFGSLVTGKTYYFYVKAVDLSGNISVKSTTISGVPH